MSAGVLNRVMSHPRTGVSLVGVNVVAAGYNIGTAILTSAAWLWWIAALNVIAAVLCAWSYQRLAVSRQALEASRAARDLSLEELDRALDGAWEQLSQTVERAHDAHKTLATERVEAYTYCPFCGKQAVHSIRAAQPLPDEYWNRRFPFGLTGLYGLHRQPPKLERHEEAKFEIVRTCNCGAEWGQR